MLKEIKAYDRIKQYIDILNDYWRTYLYSNIKEIRVWNPSNKQEIRPRVYVLYPTTCSSHFTMKNWKNIYRQSILTASCINF